MISIRKLLGKDEKFYDLLEASAAEARSAAALLKMILAQGDGANPSESRDIGHARRKDKAITQQITEELYRTFVTPLEREDIETLSLALYRIPKTVDKIVERLEICPVTLPRASLQNQAALLFEANESVEYMVKQLRRGNRVERVKDAHEKLQSVENEADKVMLELVKDLYNGPHDAKEAMILRELYDLLEKAIDRSKDAGQVIFQIMLKYS